MKTLFRERATVFGQAQGLWLFVLATLAVVLIAMITVALFLTNHTRSTQRVAGEVDTAPLPSMGATDAPVIVVQYADFQCPACGAFTRDYESAFVKTYVETGKVLWIYHDFPLPQHQNAVVAAEAAQAASEQGAFWGMHALLFANQDAWSENVDPLPLFRQYAAELQLDQERFAQDLSQHIYRDAILQRQQAAIDLGVSGTPTFLVNGVQHDVRTLQSAIEQALAASR